LKNILRLSRPLHLLLAGLTYFLGIGIAHYLGYPVNPAFLWLGLVAVLCGQLALGLLTEAFRPSNERSLPDETPVERQMVRDSALYLSVTALAFLAVISFIYYRQAQVGPLAFLFLFLMLLLVLAYSVPPVRLIDRGFGELLLSVQFAFLVPSLAFLMQTGEYHRLLSATTLPLMFLALAMFISLSFQAYAGDMKYERRTLLARLGWERALPLHHGLILAAYSFFMVSPLLGFSLRLFWPAILTLPFGVFQIYWLRNIGLGARPVWPLLNANAIAIFGLTAYLLTLAFWIR
jgi:1,4-dihydroxy-2-naphthoate octaprenyltransferase